ncbi:GNAT family N-acetyltransferase [Halalkalicoccus salilacus]|uniref:GNAT family N-acetyltransferase n=1 Tax=Halalkalicoccus salilacus TaxID=3117459 RepID=UPI00300EF89C
MEYRPIPDDRNEEFRRLVSYAFSPESGPGLDDEEKPHPGERYGLFEDGTLLCVCRHYDLTARVRGEERRVAGLSAVASPPEHRRRGYVAELLRESLADHRDRGIDFSLLWPFDHAFYRRYGWGTVNDYARYEATPETLAPAAGPDRGRFRRVGADEWASLDAIHRAHGNRADLSLRRSEAWWRRRVFERWSDDPYVYRWDDEGEPRAYLAYTVDDDGETTLQVTDMAYADHAALRQLLRFLSVHRSQIDRIAVRAPPDWPLFEMVDEPEEVECSLHAGPMFRLVDVARALERLDEFEGTLTISVSDPLAPWNGGTFSLSGGGRTTCEPTEERAVVETSIETLSQLYAGYRPLETLERVGDLRIHEEDARPTLEALFPARRTYLGEHF